MESKPKQMIGSESVLNHVSGMKPSKNGSKKGQVACTMIKCLKQLIIEQIT